MCDKITVIDRQHREMQSPLCRIMATKREFLVAKDEMSVALATVSIIISSPGMALKCYACSLVIGPFFVFLGATSDCNAGFPQWRAMAETLRSVGHLHSTTKLFARQQRKHRELLVSNTPSPGEMPGY